MSSTFKPLFRSTTRVLIPETLIGGITEALTMLEAKKVLLIADQGIVGAPAFREACSWLEQSDYEFLTHMLETREPDVEWVDSQVNAVKDFQPDVVIGIGGGSLIDLAKAVSVLITNEGPAAGYQGPNLIKKAGARKIMIPTTAGTGSEVTPGAVVVNYETGRKGAISSPFVTPDIAILEPSLTLGMPPLVMAATAMDALTHCLESYVGKAYNPFAAMCAKEAFRYLINAFPKVLDAPGDLDARREMLIGSTMAGFAIFNTDTGASHSMAYPLGTYHHVPHGIANALLIPLVMEHNINGGCTKYADLYDQVEAKTYEGTDPKAKSVELLALIRALVGRTALPKDFTGFGLTEEDIDDMARKGLNLKTALGNNPVEFGYEDAAKVLKALILSDEFVKTGEKSYGR